MYTRSSTYASTVTGNQNAQQTNRKSVRIKHSPRLISLETKGYIVIAFEATHSFLDLSRLPKPKPALSSRASKI
jgi:hypothetical protein